MKILFANHTPKQYLNGGEPLGIMSLSGFLKAEGFETRMAPADPSGVNRSLREFPAGIIAYSATTGDHQYYRSLNEKVKSRFSLFSVCGGPHPTFFPDFIRESPAIDAVCRGEGELALLDLVQRLKSGKDYLTTPNFVFRKNGGIVSNEVRPLIDDLDSLPFPDRELVYSSDPLALRNPIKTFITSRGCPYQCTYCFNHAYRELYAGKGKVIRRRSVNNVIQEIQAVRSRYPLQMIYFVDDTFLLFPDWVKEFCRRYRTEIGLPFFGNGRLDQINEPLVRELRNSGLIAMNLAIETANDEIRNQLLDRKISREQIREGVEILRRHRVKILMQNMFALPETNLADDLETYDLNRQNRVDYLHSSIYQPYPGTKLGQRAETRRIIIGDPTKIRPEDYLRGRSHLKIPGRFRRQRLNKLAAIGNYFDWPGWLISLLISLPLKPLYALIHALFKGYMGTRLYPVQRTVRDKLVLLLRLLRMHHLL